MLFTILLTQPKWCLKLRTKEKMSMTTNENEVVKYIFNRTKSILLIQNDDKDHSLLVRIDPLQCSANAFTMAEIEKNSHIKRLIASGSVQLSDYYLITEDVLGEDYGQKARIGATYLLKGTHKVPVKILKYDINTKNYTAKNTLTMAKIVLCDEDIDFEETEKQQNAKKEEVVIHRGQEENQEVVAQSAQDILQNNDTVKQVEDVDIVRNVSQQPDNDDESEILIKSGSTPFAKEVPMRKVAADTAKIVSSELSKAVASTDDVKVTRAVIKPDYKDFPEVYKPWFEEFLKKDDRKKKMTIAVCNDKEKLELLIKYCDSHIKTLAETRLAKLNAR